jgi:5-methylcytosine-specific restriction endonuclease McrA
MPKRIATFPCTEQNCGENFPKCGLITCYKKRGCRCEKCAETFSAWRRDYYERHREAEIASAKKYQEENPELVASQWKRYREENRELLNEKAKARYWDDPETHRERAKAQRANDPEGYRAKKRQWRLDNYERELERERQHHAANREKRNAASRKYAKDNPEWNRRKQHERRAKLKNCEVLKITDRDWNRMLERFRHCCYYCGSRTKLTIDHVIPVDRNGRHSIGNIIPACKSCNSSKSDKTIMEWRLGRVSPSRARRRKAA